MVEGGDDRHPMSSSDRFVGSLRQIATQHTPEPARRSKEFFERTGPPKTAVSG